jgi:hypothetical protein
VRIKRLIVLFAAAALLAVLIQAVLLAPVRGSSDRGILPPIDQPPPAAPK